MGFFALQLDRFDNFSERDAFVNAVNRLLKWVGASVLSDEDIINLTGIEGCVHEGDSEESSDDGYYD